MTKAVLQFAGPDIDNGKLIIHLKALYSRIHNNDQNCTLIYRSRHG